MSDPFYNLQASFTQITDLSGASTLYNQASTHKFGLTWSYPTLGSGGSGRPTVLQYDIVSIRIYRYIGDHNECIDPKDVPEPPTSGIPSTNNVSKLRLVYSVDQDGSNITKSTYKFNTNGERYTDVEDTIAGTVSGVTDFTDDLTTYFENPELPSLSKAHNSSTETNNKVLLNEIYATERPIVYLISTYVAETQESMGIALNTQGGVAADEDRLTAYSTKTQVRHDVLNYEFDMMWTSKMVRGSSPGLTDQGISRTAIDADALNRDDDLRSSHRGPNGRGGWAWVSDRGPFGYVFRLNLSNGIASGRATDPNQGNRINSTTGNTSNPPAPDEQPSDYQRYHGHGIAVDKDTGICWSGAGDGSISIIPNSIPDGDAEQTLTTTLKTELTEEHGNRYDDWSWQQGGFELVGTDVVPSTSEAHCTKGYGLGWTTINGVYKKVTTYTFTRAEPTEEIESVPITYQLGVFGAINSRKNNNWMAFCVKDGISKTPFSFKTGNSTNITGYLTKKLIKTQLYEICSGDTDGGPTWNLSYHNSVSVLFNAWADFYDYFHPGGVKWAFPDYSIGALSGAYSHNILLTANPVISGENLDTGDAEVTVDGQATPTTHANGDWNSWYNYRNQIASAVPMPYCINNTPNGQLIYIDSNQTEIRVTTEVEGEFIKVAGADISDPGTAIVADHAHLFPSVTASVSPASNWPFATNPYAVENRFSVGYFTTGGDVNERRLNLSTWETAEATMATPFSDMALDVDDSNNIIGFGDKRVKIYRMDMDFPANSAVFPFGPAARYPNIALDEQPYSLINTREIEWLLTRDHYEMDNVTAKTSRGGFFTSQTALVAWLSLVEFKRFEAVHESLSGRATSVTDLVTRGWDPAATLGYGDTGYTSRFGIRIDPSIYNPDNSALDDTTNIVARIRDWYNTYASSEYGTGFDNNRKGRYLHPNHNINHSVNEWKAHPDYEKVSTGTIEYKDRGGSADYWYRLQKATEFTGDSDAYNQLIANPSLSAGEYLYNYDLIHPEIILPVLSFVDLSGTNKQGFAEYLPDCYPWEFLFASAASVSSYDNADIDFTISAFPGTFIIKDWFFYNDDHPSLISNTYSDPITHSLLVDNNAGSLTQDLSTYNTSISVEHEYIDPSLGGRLYIRTPPVGSFPYASDHAILPRKTPVPFINNGSFLPYAFVTAKDVYEDIYEGYNHWTWTQSKVATADYLDDCLFYSPTSTSSLSAEAIITVYERWPEPRFYQVISDDASIRQAYFGTATYAPHFVGDSRYDKSNDFVHVSNAAGDAVRRDLFIGVEPLSSVIQDRSISRSFPISSRTISVSNDNSWITTNNTLSYYFSTDETVVDIQSNFAYLTSHTYNYGTNATAMTAEALSAGTISDKVFEQCVVVQEMEPFAKFITLSGLTVPSTYTAISAATSVLISAASGNAQFDSGDYYISGYAPYMKVFFRDTSFAHTLPISSLHWDFGDAYNEGPADIFDSESNYYTLTASQIIAGGFHWDGNTNQWITDIGGQNASHVYIMPGDYTATLTARASNTGTSDIYSEYPDLVDGEFQFSVHVVEMDPTCGVTIAGLTSATMTTNVSTVSGDSPLTVYFSMSGYTPGSFLPCEITWDIEGVTTETISRVPATVTTSQGLSVIYDSTFPNDVTRAILPVLIDTTNSGPSVLTVSVSTVICNTNSVFVCDQTETGEIIPEFIKTQDYTLFRNKIDDDGNIIYVFTDDEDDTVHTVTLSGELTNI